MVTLAEILRALLTSDARLHEPEWVAKALAAIDEHEANQPPAEPEPVPGERQVGYTPPEVT